jgi:hypothetical protein
MRCADAPSTPPSPGSPLTHPGSSRPAPATRAPWTLGSAGDAGTGGVLSCLAAGVVSRAASRSSHGGTAGTPAATHGGPSGHSAGITTRPHGTAAAHVAGADSRRSSGGGIAAGAPAVVSAPGPTDDHAAGAAAGGRSAAHGRRTAYRGQRGERWSASGLRRDAACRPAATRRANRHGNAASISHTLRFVLCR